MVNRYESIHKFNKLTCRTGYKPQGNDFTIVSEHLSKETRPPNSAKKRLILQWGLFLKMESAIFTGNEVKA